MTKDIIFSIKSPYRQSMDIIGYTFGTGEKSCCIVGALRGTEIQQMAICAQLVDALRRFEIRGQLCENRSVTVIPCANYYSMNIGKRLWTMDNTDINRMFPGYDSGETTQRIAYGLFNGIKDYLFGIQMTSFYLEGQFLPHAKIMEADEIKTCNADALADFGLPYGLIRKARPYDTTTLNYNWQIWGCKAFSLFTTYTERIGGRSAQTAVNAVLRFLTANGILNHNLHKGSHTRILREDDIRHVHTSGAGIIKNYVSVGDDVSEGDLLCELVHPLEGYTMEQIQSPIRGTVFFSYNNQLVMERADIFKSIPV
jgi:predicted deacylase